MANRNWKLNIYDERSQDYDAIQQWDQELIEIAAPPIWIYKFNLEKTLNNDKTSPLDELWNEADMMDEDAIMNNYRNGFNEEFEAEIIRDGEEFDSPIKSVGYYQETSWTQELNRYGFEDVEEELAITFNYKKMLADLRREIRIGDIIKTVRGKIYRISSAYPSDETVGWAYLHFHVIAIKPKELAFLNLPDDPNIPNSSNTGI